MRSNDGAEVDTGKQSSIQRHRKHQSLHRDEDHRANTVFIRFDKAAHQWPAARHKGLGQGRNIRFTKVDIYKAVSGKMQSSRLKPARLANIRELHCRLAALCVFLPEAVSSLAAHWQNV